MRDFWKWLETQKGKFTLVDGRVRTFGFGLDCHCPLQEYAGKTCGYVKASREKGMTQRDTMQIIHAADYCESDYPEVRNEMLRILGL